MAQLRLHRDGISAALPGLDILIASDSLDAMIETYPPASPGTRSSGSGLTPTVLRSSDVREMGTVVVNDIHPERKEKKSLALRLPGCSDADGRLVLYFDGDGRVSIHVPEIDTRPPPGVRASSGAVLRVDVELRVAEASGDGTRGIGGIVAKHVLKVIGWKVVGAAARRVGPPLVRAWEAAHRPLRVLDNESLFVPKAQSGITHIPVANRSLLFIHGTFSRVAAAFSGIPEDDAFQQRIRERYGKHIYGFDHATLATGVATNVMQLFDRLSPGHHTLDVICHSRGGLIARALRDMNEAQLKQRFRIDVDRGVYDEGMINWGTNWRIPDGVTVEVDRIIFGATPNMGTSLAQPTHLQFYLEMLMTASNLLPEFVDVTVDAILATAKLLVAEVMPQLPGLDDQKPDSSLMALLSAVPDGLDAAVQADYVSSNKALTAMRAADRTMNIIFGKEKNDVVVPTDGVSLWSGGQFKASRILSFGEDAQVHHSNLFRQSTTRDHLIEWLM
ncbi:hypothetical protein [Paraburkholderia sp. MM5384-R2]|uniref:DUF7379 domain-containing protein n=1 Tax=Paraburkholderia sp. MM5384-R2 TaxID=2723097 RepID=UPI00161B7F3C|nr:hypothetical protein [Paraburkholderia sp. MM5384-R2]MBB5498629.1 hypothetical protein [Paraburkholderia sp. MM5384-R2]